MRAIAMDLTGAKWHTSSCSNTTGGDCVEVAAKVPPAVPVRDSKTPEGPVLAFPARTWTPFVTALRDEEFQA